MANLPYLPVWVSDFLGDTQHLDCKESGAYLLLLFAAWIAPDCAIPDDDEKLARLARCSLRQWLRMKPNVIPFWHDQGGRLHQKRLDKVRQNVNDKRMKAVQSAQARWLKTNESEYAPALPTQSGRIAIQTKTKIIPLSENHTDPARGSALNGGSAPRAIIRPMKEVLASLADKHRSKQS